MSGSTIETKVFNIFLIINSSTFFIKLCLSSIKYPFDYNHNFLVLEEENLNVSTPKLLRSSILLIFLKY